MTRFSVIFATISLVATDIGQIEQPSEWKRCRFPKNLDKYVQCGGCFESYLTIARESSHDLELNRVPRKLVIHDI